MNIRLAATFSALGLPFLVTGPSAALADSQVMRMNSNITEEQVLNAQKGWCNGLLAISKAYATHGRVRSGQCNGNQDPRSGLWLPIRSRGF
jgi:hypothetical protein